MYVVLVEKSTSYSLTSTTLEEHIVGHDYRRAAIDLQRRRDVLDEVELLVGRRDPKIVSRVCDVFAFGSAVITNDGD